MTADLALLLATLSDGATLGFLVFLRVGAVMAVLPAFGELVVPARVRLALALAFTAIVAPAAAPGFPPAAGGLAAFIPLAGAEVLAGLALGIVFRLFVLALMTAGAMIAQATSLAQIFGAAAADPMPAVSHLLVIAGLALATLLGLHVDVSEAILLSYAAIPPGTLPDPFAFQRWGLGSIAASFALAFRLSAPFLVAAIVYNIAIGAINRAMPHMSVAFVCAPVMTIGALSLLALAMPGGLFVWAEALRGALADPFGAPR